MMPKIEIDERSGFCFGVVNAINQAEEELRSSRQPLYCIGDIVHNNEEVERLASLGLHTVDHSALSSIEGGRVLLRAHGEPPATYDLAKKYAITVIDATCPVVLRLQKRIRQRYKETRDINAQIVIYGKRRHAEVNGLVGQTEGTALVIENETEVGKIDFTRPVILFSQTTMSLNGFGLLVALIESHLPKDVLFEHHDTVCRQVANRIPHIAQFAMSHELVIFVAGEKSSNGKILFTRCQEANPRSVFISSAQNIDPNILKPLPTTIGICGATSTPRWQMEDVAKKLRELLAIECI